MPGQVLLEKFGFGGPAIEQLISSAQIEIETIDQLRNATLTVNVVSIDGRTTVGFTIDDWAMHVSTYISQNELDELPLSITKQELDRHELS